MPCPSKVAAGLNRRSSETSRRLDQHRNRWLSGATPPDLRAANGHPEGMTETQLSARLLEPLPGFQPGGDFPVVSLRSTTGYGASKPSAWGLPVLKFLPVLKLHSQPSHGIENRRCVQRRGRSISGHSSLRISGCPTETGGFDRSVFVPVGTTESSPALQCRVPSPASSRPGGTLEAPRTCALAVASSTALQASLGDALPFPHQPGTEVPGYFQSSLPGRRRPRVPDVLWDGCELHLGTQLLEPTPLAVPARAMELRRQGRSQMEFGNEDGRSK